MTRRLDAIVTGPADRFYPSAEVKKAIRFPYGPASPAARPLCADHSVQDHRRESSKMRRWAKRLGFGAGILLICAAGLGFLVLRASMPQTTGKLTLPGLANA